MNEPTRWLADPTEAPEGAIELLKAAHKPTAISKGALAASGAYVGKVATGVVGKAALGLGTYGATKLAIGAVVLAVAGTTTWSLSTREAGRSSEPSRTAHAPGQTASRTLAPRDPAVEAPSAPLPAPSVEPPAEAAVTAPVRAPLPWPTAAGRQSSATALPALGSGRVTEPTIDVLGREAELLERARSALPTDPRVALARVSEHGRLFPTGQLLAERELIAVDALLRLRRAREARVRAARFLESSSSGMYSDRMRQLLARAE